MVAQIFGHLVQATALVLQELGNVLETRYSCGLNGGVSVSAQIRLTN